MINSNLTLEEMSQRLTAEGIEHVYTAQCLRTIDPIVVWERDEMNGCIFIQTTIPAIDGSPEIKRIIEVGEGL